MGARHSNASHIDPRSVDLALLSVISSFTGVLGTLGAEIDVSILGVVRALADLIGSTTDPGPADGDGQDRDVLDWKVFTEGFVHQLEPFLIDAFDARPLAQILTDYLTRAAEVVFDEPIDPLWLSGAIARHLRNR